jgi:hypothetical protein
MASAGIPGIRNLDDYRGLMDLGVLGLVGDELRRRNGADPQKDSCECCQHGRAPDYYVVKLATE